jgi:hypothetical protein
MYYGGRKPRKFDYDDKAPKSVSRKVIRMIVLLLFLIAAFLFFFPSPSDEGGRGDAAQGAENAAAVVAPGIRNP